MYYSIIDLDGNTLYAASMTYKYNNKRCDCKCKATEGRMYHQFPYHIREGYPVDPKYAVKEEVHLSLLTTRVMEKLIITHGNGKEIPCMLHELRGAAYEDFEAEFYTQAVQTKLALIKALISEDILVGKTGPTGEQKHRSYILMVKLNRYI